MTFLKGVLGPSLTLGCAAAPLFSAAAHGAAGHVRAP